MSYEISSVSLDSITHFALQTDLSVHSSASKACQNHAQVAARFIEGDVKIPVAREVIKQKLDEINEKLIGVNKKVQYSFNERPRACVMTIIDTRTGDVIKEIPSKEILDMVADIWDRFGILVDEKR